MSSSTPRRQNIVVVVGAGWYGCHIAMELSKAGHKVTLIERKDHIVSQCSGTFGIRLHRGPHYPQSLKTRKDCRANFDRFVEAYPELLQWHDESIYAYSSIYDARGLPPKVPMNCFEAVCLETEVARRLDSAETTRFRHIAAAYDLKEPSVVIGTELRRRLEKRLASCNVNIRLGFEAIQIHQKVHGVSVVLHDKFNESTVMMDANFIVNASGFQSLVMPGSLPQGFEAIYQVCIAFNYQDKQPGPRPFSFIVMDGWYPCLMPTIHAFSNNDKPRIFRDYVLTHGSYTILGSFESVHDAEALLNTLELPSSCSTLFRLREATELDMCRFWPAFQGRFEYCGWRSTVVAKLRTHCEFRSSVVFAREHLIHVMPGKISNIFNACDEVALLINADGVTSSENHVVSDQDGWQYVKGSALDLARHELGANIKGQGVRSTDSLQTWSEFAEVEEVTQD